MLTIYERENLFNICYDNENTKTVNSDEFWNTEIYNIIDMATDVYIYNMNFYALNIIKKLYDHDFKDVTKDALTLGKDYTMEEGDFKYILNGESGGFYNIVIRKNGRYTRFIEYTNLIHLDIEQIIEEFGGISSVAMYRSIGMIRSLRTRGITLSSCAYAVWKQSFNYADFRRVFQDKPEEVEKLCRDAYHGGLCYLKEKKKALSGLVLDVNSLYAYILKTCRFPVGMPHFEKGAVKDIIKEMEDITYYVRFKCSFKIKDNKIPFVRTRCDKAHNHMEKLTDSRFRNSLDGKVYSHYEDEYVNEETGEVFKEVKEFTVELCMYKPEYELFLETYDVWNLEELEYVWYRTERGLFDSYVDRFYEMKKNAKTKAERRIAKLFLNALTGRMALKIDRTGGYFDETSMAKIFGDMDRKKATKGRKSNHMIGTRWEDFIAGEVNSRVETGSHIEIGAAITSEAMCYMVKIINANYKKFLYTDTDSVHLELTTLEDLKNIKGVKISDTELGAFKIEHNFRIAHYIKEKIYFTFDRDKSVNIVFAGLPNECQEILKVYIETNLQQSERYEEDITKLIDLTKFCKHIREEYEAKRFEGVLWEMIDPNRDFDIDGIKIPRVVRKMDYKTMKAKEVVEFYRCDVF